MTSRRGRKPAIPSPDDPRGHMEAVREALEQGMGRIGNPLDRWVTLRDLQDAGLSAVTVVGGSGSLTGPSGGDFSGGDGGDDGNDPYGVNDPTKPPRPTNVEAVGTSLDAIAVRWDPAPYNNHDYAEVFASPVDDVQAIYESFDVNRPVGPENLPAAFAGRTASNLFIHDGQADTVPTPRVRYSIDGGAMHLRYNAGSEERMLYVWLSINQGITPDTFKRGDQVYLRSEDGTNPLHGIIMTITQIGMDVQGNARFFWMQGLPEEYRTPREDGSYLPWSFSPDLYIEKVYSDSTDRPVLRNQPLTGSQLSWAGGGKWHLRVSFLGPPNAPEITVTDLRPGDLVQIHDPARQWVMKDPQFTVNSVVTSGPRVVAAILRGVPQSFQDVANGLPGTPYSHRPGLYLRMVDRFQTAAQDTSELDEALSPAPVYYWVRFVSTAGVVGDFQSDAGVPGTVMLDPERILNALTQRIRSTQLYNDLLAPVAFITGPVTERNEDGSRKYPTIREFVESLGDARISEYDEFLNQVFLGFLGGEQGDLSLAVVGYGRISTSSPNIWLRLELPDWLDPATEPANTFFTQERPGTPEKPWHIRTEDEALAGLAQHPTDPEALRRFEPVSASYKTDDDGRVYIEITLRDATGNYGSLPAIYFTDEGDPEDPDDDTQVLYDGPQHAYPVQGRTLLRLVGTIGDDWTGVATAAAYINRLTGRVDEHGAFMRSLELMQAAFEETTASGIHSIIATVSQRELVQASDEGALAYIVETAQVEMDIDGDGEPERYGINQMASQVVADSAGRIRNSWTVRMTQADDDGAPITTGFGLSLEPGLDGVPTSNFLVSADNFAIMGANRDSRIIEEWLEVTQPPSAIGAEIWVGVRNGVPPEWIAPPLETQDSLRVVVNFPPNWRQWNPDVYADNGIDLTPLLERIHGVEFVVRAAWRDGTYPPINPITGAIELGEGLQERWVVRLLPVREPDTPFPQPPVFSYFSFEDGWVTLRDVLLDWDQPSEHARLMAAAQVPFIVDTVRNVVGIRGTLIVDGLISTDELEVNRMLRANRILANLIHVAGVETNALVTSMMATRRRAGWALRIMDSSASTENKVLQVGRWLTGSPVVEDSSFTYTDDPNIDPMDLITEYLNGLPNLQLLYPQLQKNLPPDEETFWVDDQGNVFMRGRLEVASGAMFSLADAGDTFDNAVRMDHYFPLAVGEQRLFQGRDNTIIQPDEWLNFYGFDSRTGDFYDTNAERLMRNAFLWITRDGLAGFNTVNRAVYIDDDPMRLSTGVGGVAGQLTGPCTMRAVQRLDDTPARIRCTATASYGIQSPDFGVNPNPNRRFRGVSYALWLLPVSQGLPSLFETVAKAVNVRVVRYVGIDGDRDLTYEKYIEQMPDNAIRAVEAFDSSGTQFATLSGVVDVTPNIEYRLYMIIVERFGIDVNPSDFAKITEMYGESFSMDQIASPGGAVPAGGPKEGGDAGANITLGTQGAARFATIQALEDLSDRVDQEVEDLYDYAQNEVEVHLEAKRQIDKHEEFYHGV